MKVCTVCGETKALDDFPPFIHGKDGKRAQCRECHRAAKKQWRLTSPQAQAFDREYVKRPEVRVKVAERVKRWYAENPEKQKAQGQLRHAVNTGRLTRGACAICGDQKTHGHHEDYSKPLDVIWLCALHHRRLHGEERTT
jgi:hypothetical protein